MAETIERLKADVAAKGIMFFDEIDQAGLARAAGIELLPSVLLIFGNPPLGTLFLQANPDSGLDWPVRLLVRAGRRRPGLGRLHRLRLDRAPARHHQPHAEFAKASEVIASITAAVRRIARRYRNQSRARISPRGRRPDTVRVDPTDPEETHP